MTMQDWIDVIDDLLKFRRKKVIYISNNISHKQAVKKQKIFPQGSINWDNPIYVNPYTNVYK